MFSNFFIRRPRFALVISLVLCLAGIIALNTLPIALYPEVTPPEIVVMANYPGASAETIAKTVGIPLEEAVNGVEDMLYMSSTSSDGSYMLTVTFETGTDPDLAQVKVQNRVAQASPRLPGDVTRRGVNTFRRSSNILGLIAFTSPNKTHSTLDISDYLNNNVVKNVSTCKVMHQIADRVVAFIFAIHVNYMRFILKSHVIFFDYAVNMIERQTAFENIMLRNENHINFWQIANIFARHKYVCVNHRHIVPRPLFRCSFVIALNFDVVKLACLVFCLNIQPDRPALQILNRHLSFRLSDFQIISLQNCVQEILRSFFVVLKDLGHEIVVKETELRDFLAQKL